MGNRDQALFDSGQWFCDRICAERGFFKDWAQSLFAHDAISASVFPILDLEAWAWAGMGCHGEEISLFPFPDAATLGQKGLFDCRPSWRRFIHMLSRHELVFNLHVPQPIPATAELIHWFCYSDLRRRPYEQQKSFFSRSKTNLARLTR